MSKFSVKKPFTVLVAVIAIIVLGVVAFTSMTPDLLPSMDLPYVVLVTTYPGATPERVESTVTRPLEQAMATLENIESISSTSSENASTLILEFNAEVNMESITVDILQKVSQIQGYWDDTVGTPLILKLNPDMLPVMVAAVEMEGMDTTQLSSFADETLLNKLEGVAGVASVSASGMVQETVNVVLRQDKIDAENKRIADAINGQFDEAEAELNDAKAELEKQQGEVNLAIRQLENELSELGNLGGGMDDASVQAQRELAEAKLEITGQIAGLQSQLAQLNQAESQMEAMYKGIVALEDSLADAQQRLLALQGFRPVSLDVATRLSAAASAILNETGADYANMTPEEKAVFMQTWAAADTVMQLVQGYEALAAASAQLDTQLAALGTNQADLQLPVSDANSPIKKTQDEIDTVIKPALDALDVQLAMGGTSRDEVKAGWQALQTGKQTINTAIASLQQMLAMLDAGSVGVGDALGQLDGMVPTFTNVDIGPMAEMMVGGQLQQAMAQIESGLKQIEQARTSALNQADLTKVLTMDTLSTLLMAQNFSMPAGYVSEEGVEYLVRVDGAITTLEELSGLVLLDMGMEDIGAIHLSDVADVFISNNLDTLYAKIDGKDGVLLSFNKQSTYATAEVSDNIGARFDELAAEHPGLRFTPLMDQGDYIYIVINSILESLAFGAVFAIIILFLFLKDLRPTFITLCSIPISVMFAIVLMYFSGISLNIISLSGLAVAVGMLVDNSVVVIENIFRLRNKGVPAVQAAVAGARQVAGAIASSTLTTVCVFLPIVFVQGLTRQLFTDMALTLGYALIASLIVALTLVPAMSSGMFRKMTPKTNKLLDRALNGYDKSLVFALRHKALVLILAVALLVGSGLLVVVRGFVLMPESEPTQIMVTLRMPEESGFEELKARSDEVAGVIAEIDGVQTIGAMADSGGMAGMLGLGGLSGGGGTPTATTMYVMVDEGRGTAVEARIKETGEALGYDLSVSGSSMAGVGALSTSGISIQVYGNNTDDLFAAARAVATQLGRVEGTAEVNDGIGQTDPEIRFVVDHEKAMSHGLTAAQVFSEVSKALKNEASSTTVTFDANNYTIRIVKGDESLLTPTYIKYISIPVKGTDGTERLVSIQDLVRVEETETATSIRRTDQRRYLNVTAQLAEGHNVTRVTGAAEQAMRGVQLPTGTSYEFAGENETIMDSFRDLLNMLALGVLLVYLIMVAQFQSLKSPFIVMFTIPLAFTGGFLALLITGLELSVVALIGFIMLVGIIVNNGIVLVDYINQLRDEGVERVDAIREAGVTRMRPILMTSLTTILGLLVMAIGIGTGGELMQPVAIVCIGGLLYATLMTLYVVPVMYEMMNKRQRRRATDEELNYVEE